MDCPRNNTPHFSKVRKLFAEIISPVVREELLQHLPNKYSTYNKHLPLLHTMSFVDHQGHQVLEVNISTQHGPPGTLCQQLLWAKKHKLVLALLYPCIYFMTNIRTDIRCLDVLDCKCQHLVFHYGDQWRHNDHYRRLLFRSH